MNELVVYKKRRSPKRSLKTKRSSKIASTKKRSSKKRSSKKRSSKKRRASAKKRSSKKRRVSAKKRSSKKRSSKKRSTKKRSTKKRSTKKRSTKKRSTKKRSSKKRSTKKRRASAKKRSTKKRSSSKKRSTSLYINRMEKIVNDYLEQIDNERTNPKYKKFAEPKPTNINEIKDWEKRLNRAIYNRILHKQGFGFISITKYIKDGFKKEITKLIKNSKYVTAPYVLKNLKKYKIL
jgi:hypothetical protein